MDTTYPYFAKLTQSLEEMNAKLDRIEKKVAESHTSPFGGWIETIYRKLPIFNSTSGEEDIIQYPPYPQYALSYYSRSEYDVLDMV
jgi:hypothetical protein